MTLPILKINRKDIENPLRTLGMTEILRALEESNLFTVKYHDLSISAMRSERAAIIIFNSRRIYLDFWEYNTPTYTNKVFDYNFDLIIKLQHKPMTHEQYFKTCIRKRILEGRTDDEKISFLNKVIPWTFFCSRPVSKFLNGDLKLQNIPVDQDGFFCGKIWRCRGGWIKRLKDQNIKILSSNNEIRTGRVINDEDYLKEMIRSKYGIILRGRASHLTEGKNRREIDYMILKKPIIMNYKPFYYNPLIAGKHFIYMDEKTSLHDIDKVYNVSDIVNEASKWYEDNASPKGIAKSFLQIMTEKGFC